MRITKILKILFPYRLQAGGSSNNRQIFEHLQQNVDATGIEAVDELLHVFGKPCGKQATAETQQNGTEQNPTGQDPQFEIFVSPWKSPWITRTVSTQRASSASRNMGCPNN